MVGMLDGHQNVGGYEIQLMVKCVIHGGGKVSMFTLLVDDEVHIVVQCERLPASLEI